MQANSEDEQRRQWFREQVLPLEPKLRIAALRLARGQTHDAQDLVHDTLAKLIVHTGWRTIDNVPAYCLSILRNQALQAIRRSKIVSIVATDTVVLDAFADDLPGPDRIAQGRDEMDMLIKLVADLPPQCRRVFTLRKIYGLSHAEIAEQLGLSISTVEKHLVKGLRICSEALGREPVRATAGSKLELVDQTTTRTA
ncbi:RNA polymerase sigma-24 factor [Novosphingobium sp. Rr 2-17]|uniref:RNA polymerase sigma factor n=1 Tax=Novosphingobium sp. Rr 2-17 TaxID=555793 RepID=UPI0002698B99|nr:RNA polymerase sigma factor [Novosphingobium sp. Rr 2-17]EIZ80064.1 RNA polymerase sigma-24 factor [Novosphingobium sp. Rr 2-17]